jgi:endo-1,4-beta-xylanase
MGTLTAALALPAARGMTLKDSLFGSSPQVLDGAPLRARAAKHGLLFGAASRQSVLSTDSKFSDLFAQQCAILVPETEMKWKALRPTPDSYNFGPADWLTNFAQRHQMKFRGHTLVWHLSLPKWFDSYANPANAMQLLYDHIASVVGRYSARVHSWDVVNEALGPEDKRSDGLRDTPWLKLLGPGHIETAFHAAAEADPYALLVWNENWLEEETSYGETKRQFFLQHLRDLVKRNVPVHGVGIQSHLVGDHTNIAGPQFQRFLKQVSDLGLKILVTEADVRDYNLQADIAIRDRVIAERYYEYLSVVLRQNAVVAVLAWGLSNKYTWVSEYNPRADHAPVRPLPFDSDMNPTPAWSAIARAFDESAQHGNKSPKGYVAIQGLTNNLLTTET